MWKIGTEEANTSCLKTSGRMRKNCDEYTLGSEFMLTRNEVKLMEII